jgi:hypothetical protein
MLVFTSEVDQNKYLAVGATQVHAVVTVTAAAGADGPRAATPADAAEVIMLDCSGSMGGGKIVEARRAAAAAIDTLRDGVSFAVVQGESFAKMIYPAHKGLAIASAATRDEAKRAVGRMVAGGGTTIATWLQLTRELMVTRPDAIHHAILLTDGQTSTDGLAAALSACEGVFQCDCRGVGAGWNVDQLRDIATRLLGTVDLVRRPDEMAADFRAMIETALGRGVDKVSLRLWAPRGATVRFVRQVLPEADDLTDRATDAGALTRDYPTGAWGADTRAYHVCVEVPPLPVDPKNTGATISKDRLAAKVSLVVGGEELSPANVLAAWTEEIELSTRMDKVVAHYTGQAELAQAIQDGMRAWADGLEETAATHLGKAARLATEAGHTAALDQLAKVVDIEDAGTGKVTLRRSVDKLDKMDLDASSTKTVPAPR